MDETVSLDAIDARLAEPRTIKEKLEKLAELVALERENAQVPPPPTLAVQPSAATAAGDFLDGGASDDTLDSERANIDLSRVIIDPNDDTLKLAI